MSELKTLYRHASHYLGGRACLMLIGFLSFPVLTRIFSVADYGVMGLVLKIVLLFTVLAKFGLQNSVQRFYPEDGMSPDLTRRRRYYSTVVFGAVAISIVVAIAFSGTLWFVRSPWLDINLRKLLLFCALLIVARSLQPTLIGFLRAQGKTKWYNFTEISIKALAVLLACSLLVAWRKSLLVFFGSMMGIELLGILVLVIWLRSEGLLRLSAFDWQYFRECALFAFPLIGYEIASVILDSGDRVLIQHYVGSQPLGYYSAAYNIATYAEEAVMIPINLALFPIYMKLWVEKGKVETEAFLSRSLNNFVTLAIGIVCLVLVTSRDVILSLASAKFQAAHSLLPVLVTGLLIYAIHIFFNAGLLIHKKTATMTGLVVCGCVVNILLNVILIPKLGLQGAALSTLLSYLFLVVAMARVSSRLLHLRLRYSGLIWSCIAAGLAFVLCYRIEFSVPLISALAKATAAALLYVGFVCLLDSRIRRLLFSWLSHPRETQENGTSELVAIE